MLIDINTISRSVGAFLTIEAQISPADLALTFQDEGFDQPLDFRGQLQNSGRNVYSLTGTLQSRYTSVCARCLAPASIAVETTIAERFEPEQPETVRNPDLECYRYAGHVIDIGQALRDNLLLALPQRLLCREDCPGLCPTCGKNLNEGPCDCADGADGQVSPFDLLKKLL